MENPVLMASWIPKICLYNFQTGSSLIPASDGGHSAMVSNEIIPDGDIHIASRSSKVSPHERYRKRDLFVHWTILFGAIMTVSLVLLGFVFYPSLYVHLPDNGRPGLPVDRSSVSSSVFYTRVLPARVALVSSWAVHASQFTMPPFMILFSYLVAREVSFQRPSASTIKGDRQVANLLQGLLKGAWKDLWTWFKFSFHGRGRTLEMGGVHVAAAGMLMAVTFTVLLLAAETWLHLTVKSSIQRIYYDPWIANDTDIWSVASVIPVADCNSTLQSPLLDPFVDTALRPCSLNTTTQLYGLADAPNVYETLDQGISDVSSNFNLEDFDKLFEAVGQGTKTLFQIVTHVDPETSLQHALMFNVGAAYQYDDEFGKNNGMDFLATTTSMVTKCDFVTQSCQLNHTSQSASQDFSIPFNCSAMFTGDLNQAPLDGLEQFKGWHSSFYSTVDNGIPKTISVESQLNPFLFNATAAVNSASFQELSDKGNVEATRGNLVDAGNNRVAFALSCSATVYDVELSFINGSITGFNATRSDPRLASIIKAPLQVGFGRHNLFRAASQAVIRLDVNTADAMALSFSQIGMALASGAFTVTSNPLQRWRYDALLTAVPKAPLCFIIAICLLYALLSIAVVVAAICLRHVHRYSQAQSDLLPRRPAAAGRLVVAEAWSLQDLVKPETGWSGPFS